MRLTLSLAFVILSQASHAAPTIDPNLYRHVPRQAVVELALFSEAHFQKSIDSITYIPRDFPPVGARAVAVRFAPVEQLVGTYKFSSGLFYFSAWKGEWASHLKEPTITLGRWTTPSRLNSIIKNQLLAGRVPVFVSISSPLTATSAQELLTAIQSKSYTIGEVVCPYPKMTALLRKVGLSRVSDLDATKVDTAYSDKYGTENVIVLSTTEFGWWSFQKKGGSYKLVCMWQSVI